MFTTSRTVRRNPHDHLAHLAEQRRQRHPLLAVPEVYRVRDESGASRVRDERTANRRSRPGVDNHRRYYRAARIIYGTRWVDELVHSITYTCLSLVHRYNRLPSFCRRTMETPSPLSESDHALQSGQRILSDIQQVEPPVGRPAVRTGRRWCHFRYV